MFRVSTKKVVAIFALVLCSLSFAQNKRAMDFDVTHTPDALIFDINENSESYVVRIAGPNNLEMTFEFDGDETPFIDLFNQEGELLADGFYRYEITSNALVSEDVAEMMAMARGEERTRVAAMIQSIAPISGSFTIMNGEVLDPAAVEVGIFVNNNENTSGGTPVEGGEGTGFFQGGIATDQDAGGQAQVFTTDLIVQGSGCIGVDCNTSESFGFDTLRLKENNLRMHFDDTSASASFPKNDWRLTANDSGNGGAEYFSIDDATAGTQALRVDAGAGNNALVIESGGFVGFGTDNPAVDLHVKQGNSPALRLEQDGSSGFTSQTWDLAGNETNFFLRDVTNGSLLPFRVQPSSPKNSIYIKPAGVNINQGDNHTPQGALDVKGALYLTNDSTADGIDMTTDTGTVTINSNELRMTDTGTGAATMIRTSNGGPVTWRMDNNGAGSNWTFTLDNSGSLKISENNASSTLLTLTQNGDMTIAGTLTQSGGNKRAISNKAAISEEDPRDAEIAELKARLAKLEALVGELTK